MSSRSFAPKFSKYPTCGSLESAWCSKSKSRPSTTASPKGRWKPWVPVCFGPNICQIFTAPCSAACSELKPFSNSALAPPRDKSTVVLWSLWHVMLPFSLAGQVNGWFLMMVHPGGASWFAKLILTFPLASLSASMNASRMISTFESAQ